MRRQIYLPGKLARPLLGVAPLDKGNEVHIRAMETHPAFHYRSNRPLPHAQNLSPGLQVRDQVAIAQDIKTNPAGTKPILVRVFLRHYPV